MELFSLQRSYRDVFTSGLELKNFTSEKDKKLCQKIRNVFQAGVNKSNYVEFFHLLLWYEEAISKDNLKKYNMTDVPLLLINDNFVFTIPGLSMKRPSLVIGDTLKIKPHNEKLTSFETVKIHDVKTKTNLVIIKREIECRRIPNQYFKENAKFDIQFVLSRVALERMHAAVEAAGAGCELQRRVFPTENLNTPIVQPISIFFNSSVEKNPEQKRAVEHIVSRSSGLAPYLLHGPPGTGKTVTIVEAILQLVKKNPNNRILVCADSNAAADNVATALVKYNHLFDDKLLLRVNSNSRNKKELPKSLKNHSRSKTKANTRPRGLLNFEDLLDEDDIDFEFDWDCFNIVVTTLSYSVMLNSTQHNRLPRSHTMSHVFIDEAAQASEPATLVPLKALLASGGQIVLAGDPRQLGPVCISHHAESLGLGLSLMERLKKTCDLYNEQRNDPNYVTMLRNNYRSDPAILDIPNAMFYNGQLRALATKDPISKMNILDKKLNSRAIVFHGVLSREQRVGQCPSFYNSMEVEKVQKYIKLLIENHSVKPEDIGVVTPYNGQVSKIKSWLAQQSFGSGVEVGSVEAFQGREKRVVIISTVRARGRGDASGVRAQLGFLTDDARFNVAITRAKAKVVVIGNPHCLELDEKWRAYIRKCRELGTYHGYDSRTGDNSDEIAELFKGLKVTQKYIRPSKISHRLIQ